MRQKELRNYLTPFGNCTTIVMMPESGAITVSKLSENPIVFTNNKFTDLAKLEMIFSVQRRRNPSKHCWASFAIYPESNYMTKYLQYGNNHVARRRTVQHQYLVLLTSFKSSVKKSVEKKLTMFRLEIVLGDITSYVDGIVRQVLHEYYNSNHDANIVTGDGSPSKPWYRLECFMREGADCFDRLESIARVTADLNKYFWQTRPRINLGRSIICHTIKSRQIYKVLADSGTFAEFIVHLLWDDNCHNASGNRFLTPFVENIVRHNIRSTPIIESVRTYGFISFYMVKRDTLILSAFSDPFDVQTWIALCLVFTLFVTMLTILSG